MAFTLCTSGSAINKAGANANSTITASGSALNTFSDEAEGTVCSRTNYDWVTTWNSALSGSKYAGIVSSVASGIVAKKIINYDMSGYTSRNEAQAMLILIDDEVEKNIATLKDSNVRLKLGAS